MQIFKKEILKFMKQGYYDNEVEIHFKRYIEENFYDVDYKDFIFNLSTRNVKYDYLQYMIELYKIIKHNKQINKYITDLIHHEKYFDTYHDIITKTLVTAFNLNHVLIMLGKKEEYVLKTSFSYVLKYSCDEDFYQINHPYEKYIIKYIHRYLTWELGNTKSCIFSNNFFDVFNNLIKIII